MSDLSQLCQTTNDLTSAYDERTRLFNALRKLTLTDVERKKAIDNYVSISKIFEKLRSDLMKTPEAK